MKFSAEVRAEIRAEIKACQGKLSLAKAAKRFGVSRRTVGRIYHDAERSPAGKADSGEVMALQEQVARLSETVLSLTRMIDDMQGSQQFRRALNPELHGEIHLSQRTDYSSPYRDSPGKSLVTVYGFYVPLPFSWSNVAGDPWFISQNPVSPESVKYPYPYHGRPVNRGEDKPVYRDPPAGVSCACENCKEWRLGLAFEAALLKRLHGAVLDQALWRAGCR